MYRGSLILAKDPRTPCASHRHHLIAFQDTGAPAQLGFGL